MVDGGLGGKKKKKKGAKCVQQRSKKTPRLFFGPAEAECLKTAVRSLSSGRQRPDKPRQFVARQKSLLGKRKKKKHATRSPD